MKSSAIIYSIQTNTKSNGLLHIETVVSGGVYNFSILGISAKNASDVKSRVYTALRTEGLLNLKSDNRKITVNLISDTEDIITSCSELGIALSCICCVSGLLWPDNILAVGSLSITGNIIPSNKILQAIYVALNKGINYIACSLQDIQNLDSVYIKFAEKNGIRFIVGQSLKEIVSNLRNCTLYEKSAAERQTEQDSYEADNQSYAPTSDIKTTVIKNMQKNPLVWIFFIALCGRHKLIIESNKTVFLDDLLALGDILVISHKVSRILSVSNICKTDDSVVQDIVKKHRYIHVNNQTPKKGRSLRIEKQPEKDPVDELGHFIFLQGINSIHKDIWQEYYSNKYIHKISTCYVCPCGQIKKKCICFQKSILKYKYALQTDHLPIYSICTEQLEPLSISYTIEEIKVFRNILQNVHQTQFDRHIQEQNIYTSTDFNYMEYDFFNTHRDTNLILPLLDPEALETYHILAKPLNLKSKQNLLQITQTLQDIYDYIDNRKGEIRKETLLLAYSYIPKTDF